MRVETAYLPPEHRGVAAGVDATTVERTVADLAGRLCPGEALAAVDSALRMDAALARIDEAAAVAGHDVDSLTRRVIRAGDVRSDSPLESMSRWLIHDHGLPSPEPHVLIGDDEGPFAVVDFLWREQRVIGEVDGMLKYDVDRSALRAEKLRQERLERLGFRVVRWGWHDVTVAPYLLAARLSRCLTAI